MKRHARKIKDDYFERMHKIPTVVIAILFLAMSVISIFALRQNNLTMLKLRNALYQADKDNTDIEGTLRNLRQYVYTHMNTSLVNGSNGIRPPIQLQYTYERAVAAERTRVSAINEKVNKEAQAACEQQYGRGQVQARLKCVDDYNASKGAKEVAIPDSFYKFDFVSPWWSPDLAGYSCVMAVALLGWLTSRLLFDRIVQMAMRRA